MSKKPWPFVVVAATLILVIAVWIGIGEYAWVVRSDLPSDADWLNYPLLEQRTGPPPCSGQSRRVGCMFAECVTYIMLKDGEFLPTSDFRAAFAPVESAREALTYASIRTGWGARSKFVAKTEEGYVVHLTHGPVPDCGCGTHIEYALDVLVTRDGDISEMKRKPVREFEACLD